MRSSGNKQQSIMSNGGNEMTLDYMPSVHSHQGMHMMDMNNGGMPMHQMQNPGVPQHLQGMQYGYGTVPSGGAGVPHNYTQQSNNNGMMQSYGSYPAIQNNGYGK